MENFKELVSLCKCEVHISVNPHKSTYESVKGWLSNIEYDDTEPEVIAEMIKHDRIVWVQAYPTTPIGFYVAYHWDIDTAINQVLEAVKEK